MGRKSPLLCPLSVPPLLTFSLNTQETISQVMKTDSGKKRNHTVIRPEIKSAFSL